MLATGAVEAFLQATTADAAGTALAGVRMNAAQPNTDRLGLFIELTKAAGGAVTCTLRPVVELRDNAVQPTRTQFDLKSEDISISGTAADDGTGAVVYREYIEVAIPPLFRVGLRLTAISADSVKVLGMRGSSTRG